MIIIYLFLIILIIIILISLAWRLGSRKCALPCPVWMKWMLDPHGSNRISARTQKTIERLDLKSGMSVLDAGCGPGRLTIPIAKIVGPNGIVTAMDIQEGMLSEVHKRADSENLTNVSYLQAGIGEGKLGINRYDRAVMITVIGEIPDREGALEEIHKALKPGGFLLIEETIRDPHYQTRTTVQKLTYSQGFIEKSFFGNRFSYGMVLQKPSNLK